MTTHSVPYAGIATRGVALAADTVIVQGALLLFTGDARPHRVTAGRHSPRDGREGHRRGALDPRGGGLLRDVLVGGGPDARHARDAHPRGRPRRRTARASWRSIIRVIGLGLCILTLFIGFIPVLFNARRRGAHDTLARTVVFYDDVAEEPVPAVAPEPQFLSPDATQTVPAAAPRPPST